jgi:hypothetical protein
MIDATTLRRISNRLRSAIAVCDDALLPLLERMPEGGWVGKARAVIQAFQRELHAIGSELDEAAPKRPEDTPARSPSGMMQAVETGVSGVRGIASRTRSILEGGKT